MHIYHSFSEYNNQKKSVITIGTFDGVHIGHRKILEKLKESAQYLNCESVVLTFFPHPRMILQAESNIKLLNTVDEKIFLLNKIAIDNLIVHPFDKEFSLLSAEEFVKNILVDKLNIQKIIIGHDHRFGKNRTANINDLIVFGKKYNFEVEQISVQELNEIAVSSTKIRNAIHDGNLNLANDYLTYNYFFSGKVISGKKLGRTIGFPTANIEIKEDYKLIPKNGVYIVQSCYENKIVFGMMNIGNRPTVSGENQTIEVYFFNFDADLYNSNLTISILDKIREEQKFNSLEALKLQLEADKIYSLGYLSSSSRI
ncbi:MAG: bifunctional riboflavin kinase/FAD synthetase [Flavobacterium sp.]|nr:bifunctional riboflavin kinase/FAD synthetase [Flavobacterium sp.]